MCVQIFSHGHENGSSNLKMNAVPHHVYISNGKHTNTHIFSIRFGKTISRRFALFVNQDPLVTNMNTNMSRSTAFKTSLRATFQQPLLRPSSSKCRLLASGKRNSTRA